MHKAWLIIKREYFTRVRKRSFLLITFLSPLFFALMFIAPIIASKATAVKKKIYVIDNSGMLEQQLTSSNPDIELEYLDSNAAPASSVILANDPDAFILHIPPLDIDNPQGIYIESNKTPSMPVLSFLESSIEKRIEDIRFTKSGIDKELLKKLKAEVTIKSRVIDKDESIQTSTAAASVLSFGGGFLIYLFIFLYGGQVTSGVHEEKTSRIVEILISSVKPYQLMFGKIVGLAMVGLTQFLLWIFFTGVLMLVTALILGPEVMSDAASMRSQINPVDASAEAEMISKVMVSLEGINFLQLGIAFIFYFLGGYFIYSSLFAAIAASVDNQSDMRQFIMPLSLPLLFSVIMSTSILENPDSGLAIWLSIIPLTSPVVMIARLPFGVPEWQIIASVLSLILGFVLAVWIAAKIYRVGILMYGKKITFREILKWVSY